jgi:hypothetical protein
MATKVKGKLSKDDFEVLSKTWDNFQSIYQSNAQAVRGFQWVRLLAVLFFTGFIVSLSVDNKTLQKVTDELKQWDQDFGNKPLMTELPAAILKGENKEIYDLRQALWNLPEVAALIQNPDYQLKTLDDIHAALFTSDHHYLIDWTWIWELNDVVQQLKNHGREKFMGLSREIDPTTRKNLRDLFLTNIQKHPLFKTFVPDPQSTCGQIADYLAPKIDKEYRENKNRADTWEKMVAFYSQTEFYDSYNSSSPYVFWYVKIGSYKLLSPETANTWNKLAKDCTSLEHINSPNRVGSDTVAAQYQAMCNIVDNLSMEKLSYWGINLSLPLKTLILFFPVVFLLSSSILGALKADRKLTMIKLAAIEMRLSRSNPLNENFNSVSPEVLTEAGFFHYLFSLDFEKLCKDDPNFMLDFFYSLITWSLAVGLFVKKGLGTYGREGQSYMAVLLTVVILIFWFMRNRISNRIIQQTRQGLRRFL